MSNPRKSIRPPAPTKSGASPGAACSGLEDDDPETLETLGEQFGVSRERIRQLESRMNEAAEQLLYEAAAVYRDWIAMVRDISERQKMILEGQEDTDLFGYHHEGSRLAMEVFVMRGGRVLVDACSPRCKSCSTTRRKRRKVRRPRP